MIEQDTIKLLRECDEGVKMGISSIEDVLGHVRSDSLERRLTDCKREHESLSGELQRLLARYQDGGKDPPAMASAMSGLMTKMKLKLHSSDAEIADLMTDGCNMGIQSVSEYVNKYPDASRESQDVAKKLIGIEEDFMQEMKGYV